MPRTILSDGDLSRCAIRQGRGWFDHYRINTKTGPREAFRRRTGEVHACKVLALLVDDARLGKILPHGRCSLQKLCAGIRSVGLEHLNVPFLATDRPLTYFHCSLRLRENFLYELPGGVVEHGEEVTIGGIRELFEETGLGHGQVLSYARLTPHPAPYDAGSHVEWTQLVAALCSGAISPRRRESIMPAKCRTVPLLRAEKFLRKSNQKGIGIDGYCFAALDGLCRALTGGLPGIKKK